MGLQADFELRAQHPRLALFSVHHKRIASVRYVEKSGTATQLDMPLAATEIHGNRAVGIQGDLRLIRQGDGADFPRRRDIVRPQVIDPARRLPARAEADHQHQARRHCQRTGPTPHTGPARAIHGVEVTLQGQGVVIGQGSRRYFGQLPHHLRLGIRLGMGGVRLQPVAEGGLIAAARAGHATDSARPMPPAPEPASG